MKTNAYVFLGTFLALLLISYVAGDDRPTQNEIKADQANEVVDQQQYIDGYGGGWGGPGGGYGGGRGGYGGGGWGGPGGGGGGWGGGGWGGGGGCRYGRCCGGGRGYYGGGGYGGGCRCCYSAQEALAYMQNEARP